MVVWEFGQPWNAHGGRVRSRQGLPRPPGQRLLVFADLEDRHVMEDTDGSFTVEPRPKI